MRVSVIGAGIHGTSAALELARRGHLVRLFDRYPPGHAFGSSHGQSRIVRRAYPDAFFTRCMKLAYPLWHRLERESGRTLLHEVGLLYFGRNDSPDLRSVESGLQSEEVSHSVYEGRELADRFPAFRFNPDEIGIFTPEAGWVEADTAWAATFQLFLQLGGQFFVGEPIQDYDARVLCPGPWVKEFWPESPTRVTKQTVAYVQGQLDGPVWIEDGPDFLYGFPTEQEGFKIGVHRPGPEVDPHDPDRTPAEEYLEMIRDAARRRFGVENPVLTRETGCLYTTTPEEDFRIFELAPRTFLASACSGHGFKFAPWIGSLLADFVEGHDAPENYPRFAPPVV